ncbi:hypothetical protein Nepgr_014026 [Nepenthes gracilis]|uniref:Protein kinase domain-containing protein n=1 Tax=Nepenthes gracilis TaxID=150966 RepID=A0AAD3SIH3_NEPGR|nr:hypothetical protein Nepgr_014026 [Nepenthes gracilis]
MDNTELLGHLVDLRLRCRIPGLRYFRAPHLANNAESSAEYVSGPKAQAKSLMAERVEGIKCRIKCKWFALFESLSAPLKDVSSKDADEELGWSLSHSVLLTLSCNLGCLHNSPKKRPPCPVLVVGAQQCSHGHALILLLNHIFVHFPIGFFFSAIFVRATANGLLAERGKSEIAMENGRRKLWVVVVFCLFSAASCETDPNDLRILNEFRKGLDNPELLKWPTNSDDPCGPPSWSHVFCSGNRVSQIQVQGMGLKGPLPQDLNQLSMLSNLGLQKNKFSGKLPTFSGLSELQFAYLDYNNFDTIPWDFFDGLTNIRVLALDYNPLNATTGWSLPDELGKIVQLTNLSLINSNLVGPLPEFLSTLPSLTVLKLSYNRLSGVIPKSLNESMIQILWLNDQAGGGMTGPIDVISSMISLSQLWLHGNGFTGTIPEGIGALSSLKDLNLNKNRLSGVIPESMANMSLEKLDLSNNLFMGPIPQFKFGNVSYGSNSFCQSVPGIKCASEVNSLIEFLGGMNYPSDLASEWSGNDPCEGPWLGLSCNPHSKVTIINLPNRRLNGTLSPSVANLTSLLEIRLKANNLNGQIPTEITHLMSLRLLDISANNFEPPLPYFGPGVKVIVDGNPLLKQSKRFPTPVSSRPLDGIPPLTSAQSPSKYPMQKPPSPGMAKSPWIDRTHPAAADFRQNKSDSVHLQPGNGNSGRFNIAAVVSAAAASVLLVLLTVLLFFYGCKKKKKHNVDARSSVVIHPRNPIDQDRMFKTAGSRNTTESLFTQTASSSESRTSSVMENSHVIESGNLVISVHVLRKVTNNFAPENQLGRGGFGVVYRGELEDGTKIAVKRMEAGVISSKALDEFHAEITVLSKVRHRHLVSLFAPDGEKSVVTRLAGTFGYLAPEYAVTGKITTKVDVFSYGVVLMELLTGRMALDEERPEESRYLAEWFWKIKSSKPTLMAAVDPALDVKDEAIESISTIADLARHCTAREPCHRPDMGRAVSILVPLVEQWEPLNNETDTCSGVDFKPPLLEMVKAWQETQRSSGNSCSRSSLDDSTPAKPTGFAGSFTSADAR